MEVIKGRMYDYNNGRFLSVDPFIASPTSTQAMNPYTYIFNNPLSGVDPSGYLPIFVPLIIKGFGYASAAWGAKEMGPGLGKATAEVATGNKGLGEAAGDFVLNNKAAIATTVAGGAAAKLANKMIPDSVKDKVTKALTNGNKNNQQTTTTTQNKDISSIETNNDQKMIDNLVNKRRDTDAPGEATFAQGRDKNGNLTDVKESKVNADGSTTHAETQVLDDLQNTRGATVAVDQLPCSTCTGNLKNAGVDKVIVPSTPKPGNPTGSPKTAARGAAEKGKKVTPREIELEEK